MTLVIAPPQLDLKFATRLAKLITGVNASDVLNALTNYPNVPPPEGHWPWASAFSLSGTPLISHRKAQPVVRLLFSALAQGYLRPQLRPTESAATEPAEPAEPAAEPTTASHFPDPFILPPTYRVERVCGFRTCVHPICHRLKPIALDRFGFAHDLPEVLRSPEHVEAGEVRDLVDEFLNLDESELELPALVSRYGAVFSESAIQQALAHVLKT